MNFETSLHKPKFKSGSQQDKSQHLTSAASCVFPEMRCDFCIFKTYIFPVIQMFLSHNLVKHGTGDIKVTSLIPREHKNTDKKFYICQINECKYFKRWKSLKSIWPIHRHVVNCLMHTEKKNGKSCLKTGFNLIGCLRNFLTSSFLQVC